MFFELKFQTFLSFLTFSPNSMAFLLDYDKNEKYFDE